MREVEEETGLQLENLRQFHVYSDPRRDPRQHTVSVVFTARGKGAPQAADDARAIGVFPLHALPENLAFDHARILSDYSEYVQRGI